MTGMTSTIPAFKAQARRLRTGLADGGHTLSHGAALELVARQHGYRDWNTLSALAERDPTVADLTIGAAVSGRYLGQDFTGRLVGLQVLPKGGRYRATIQFDAPVDVVAFESFSAFRHRVTVVVDSGGATKEKTSNGRPHLELAF
jgi:hypothetical protein